MEETKLDFEYRCPKCGNGWFRMQPDNEAQRRGRKIADAILAQNTGKVIELSLETYQKMTYTCSDCGSQSKGTSNPLKLKRV